jgi:hypothetical protein
MRMRHLERVGLLARVRGIEQHVRVQVAIAGMEHVARLEALLGRECVDVGERLGEPRARHDAVHDREAARRATVRTERALAPLPELRAFVGIACDARAARALLARECRDPLGLRAQRRRRAIDLDEQQRGRIGRQAHVQPGLDELGRVPVHDLHGGRHDAFGDHARHGAARVGHGREVEQHRLHVLRHR